MCESEETLTAGRIIQTYPRFNPSHPRKRIASLDPNTKHWLMNRLKRQFKWRIQSGTNTVEFAQFVASRGLEKRDELGELTNYADRKKLYKWLVYLAHILLLTQFVACTVKYVFTTILKYNAFTFTIILK